MVGKLHKRTIRKVPLAGKTVLLRTDYNVPMTDGKIDDDFRIRASLPTIRKLLDDGCKIVIISHCGRPNGTKDMRYTLEPVAQRLAELLRSDVRFVDDCVGKKVEMAIKRAPKNSVIMLENLRFYPEEEANDDAFAANIVQSTHAEYFVQDGFGVVHRAHASTSAITQHVPSAAGLLLEKEYVTIRDAVQHPRRPFLALLGGAKISDKIHVIQQFVATADQIVLGGAMANTFLAYHGHDMAKSKLEKGQETVIRNIYERVAQKVGDAMVDNFLVLPTDVLVAEHGDAAKTAVRQVDALQSGDVAYDIGPDAIERMQAAIARSQTVIWNGTMGFAEQKVFRAGSVAAADSIANQQHGTSVIGGGDTAAFVMEWGGENEKHFSHISTGGGASLDLMAGKKLPGVEALLDA